VSARLQAHELDAAISGEHLWEDTRTPEEIEADARAAVCEAYDHANDAEPKYVGVFFDDPLADWACILAVVLACAVLACVVPGPANWN